jgi:hypothetical protein
MAPFEVRMDMEEYEFRSFPLATTSPPYHDTYILQPDKCPFKQFTAPTETNKHKLETPPTKLNDQDTMIRAFY